MIIQNKKTQVETFVTPEQWEEIKNHPHLKHKFKVVDTTELKRILIKPLDKKEVIVSEEILKFQKEQKIKQLRKLEEGKKESEISPYEKGQIKKIKKMDEEALLEKERKGLPKNR